MSRSRALRTGASSSIRNTMPRFNEDLGPRVWHDTEPAWNWTKVSCPVGGRIIGRGSLFRPGEAPREATQGMSEAVASEGRRRWLVVAAATVAAYYAGAQLGIHLRFPPAVTSVIWPP